MSTLRELLKDKKLPVKVIASRGPALTVKYLGKEYAVAESDNGDETTLSTEYEKWTLYTEPRKKRKMYATLSRTVFHQTDDSRTFSPWTLTFNDNLPVVEFVCSRDSEMNIRAEKFDFEVDCD